MHLIEFLLCLLFHPSNVVHCQVNPPVYPAEELPVEVGKQALFLLKATKEKKEIVMFLRPVLMCCSHII